MNKKEKSSSLIASLGCIGIIFSLIMVSIDQTYYLISEILIGIGLTVFVSHEYYKKYYGNKTTQPNYPSVEDEKK